MRMGDVLRDEFIGKKIKVIASTNKTLVGVQGKVVDETQQTLVLEDGRKLLKSQVEIEVQHVSVDGKRLVGRPEDRLKKVKKQ
jgi:ribonuclease P protein subunit POP4